MTILNKQKEMLKNIYETVILRKMGFRKKFPRNILYLRMIALGIASISLNTIPDVLYLKLCISYNRIEREV